MQRVLALVGPTAVGKSIIAVELARRIDAEIISCDSMQVYRHMRVLTQAPTHPLRAQVQHHLVECVEPSHAFSVGEYRRIAVPVINSILERGKRVLIVGGTGLYLKSLTDGLCDAPPGDTKVREKLWSECQGVGSTELHNRLRGVDTTAASRIHPNDARRIIRALEVYALTGRPISNWWRQASAELLRDHGGIIGLNRDREELYKRIRERILHQVYEEGVINEARKLLGLVLSRSARQVHGLAEIEQYLAGETALTEMAGRWEQRVRNYVRRQLIWYRQTAGIHWLTIPPDERPWETNERILDLVRHAEPAAVGAQR